MTSSTAGRGRPYAYAIFAVGLAVHLLFLISLRTHWCDPLFLETGGIHGQAGDFFGIYQAGDNLTQGRSIYADEGRPEGASRRVPYFYFYRYLPPTAYVAALGAILLPPWPAYWCWVCVNEALLLLMLYSLTRLRAPPAAVRLALAGLALAFAPFYLEQWMGQFSFLMGVFLWGTFWPFLTTDSAAGVAEEGKEEAARTLLRRRDLWSWSAAIALKNYPALFALPLLRRWQWRRVGLAAALVILICLPYYLLHPADLERFAVLNFRPMPAHVLGGAYSLASLVRALGWHLPQALAGRRLVLGSADVYVGNVPMLAVNAAAILLSLWATWRMRGGAVAEIMALWVLTFFLIYKDVWEYHYVMLLPVVWLLAVRGDWRWPVACGCLLALPTPFALYRGTWGGHTLETWPLGLLICHFGAKLAPIIALYAVALRRGARLRSI